jgi:hypothetical protein
MAYRISGNDCLVIAYNRDGDIFSVNNTIRYNSGDYMRDILLQIQKNSVGIRAYHNQFRISANFLVYLE